MARAKMNLDFIGIEWLYIGPVQQLGVASKASDFPAAVGKPITSCNNYRVETVLKHP